MEFDKSKVYTALNADELKVGSKVIVGDNVFELKEKLKNGGYVNTLKEIFDENRRERFGTDKSIYTLAYLISEPEEKKLKWTDLKVGDIIRRKDNKEVRMVTGIHYDVDDDSHIYARYFIIDKDLEEWEKVEK